MNPVQRGRSKLDLFCERLDAIIDWRHGLVHEAGPAVIASVAAREGSSQTSDISSPYELMEAQLKTDQLSPGKLSRWWLSPCCDKERFIHRVNDYWVEPAASILECNSR